MACEGGSFSRQGPSERGCIRDCGEGDRGEVVSDCFLRPRGVTFTTPIYNAALGDQSKFMHARGYALVVGIPTKVIGYYVMVRAELHWEARTTPAHESSWLLCAI